MAQNLLGPVCPVPLRYGARKQWHAQISVRGAKIQLGNYDDEEDAARAHDAARVKYRNVATVNFPGEAPSALVLAALPESYDASVATAASAASTPRRERSLAARRVVPPLAPQQAAPHSRGPTPCEMRRIGDAEWRCFGSRADAAKAFGVSGADVSLLVRDPSKTSLCRSFEARPGRSPPKKRKRPTKKKQYAPYYGDSTYFEGARQKSNGKWMNHAMFPSREFDNIDAYRAARTQHMTRRAEWSAQIRY